jgi:hypothetical protein
VRITTTRVSGDDCLLGFFLQDRDTHVSPYLKTAISKLADAFGSGDTVLTQGRKVSLWRLHLLECSWWSRMKNNWKNRHVLSLEMCFPAQLFPLLVGTCCALPHGHHLGRLITRCFQQPPTDTLMLPTGRLSNMGPKS